MTWKESGKIQEGEHVCDELNVQEDQDDDVVHDKGAVQGMHGHQGQQEVQVVQSEQVCMISKVRPVCACCAHPRMMCRESRYTCCTA